MTDKFTKKATNTTPRVKQNKREERESGQRIQQHFYCIADELIEEGFEGTFNYCGSSDALSVYEKETEDGEVFYDAHCWSCAQSFSHEHLAKSSLAEELGIDHDGNIPERKTFSKASKAEPLTKDQVKGIIKAVGYDSKNYRGIKDEFARWYGCLTKIGKNGSVEARYYPETEDGKVSGYTIRKHPKNFNNPRLGRTGQGSDLYGQARWKKGGGKYVMVCGGQEDCHAALQMFVEYNRSRSGNDYDPFPIVSPTTGEASAYKQLAAQYDWLDTYDYIYLALDSDKAGKDALEKCIEVLPSDKVYIVTWSGKDPNKMLEDGKSKQFIRDFYNAKPYFDDGIKTSSGMYEAVLEELGKKRLELPQYMHRMQDMMGGGILPATITNIIADTSTGKCLGKGTKVMMFDGSLSNVEDIRQGDVVMGADGTKRTVLSTTQGVSPLYEVKQKDGFSYVVNNNHILSLRAGYDVPSVSVKKGDIVNMEVEDYVQCSPKLKRSLKGYKADFTNMNEYSVDDPYILGLWLADGTSSKPEITFNKEDIELIEYYEGYIQSKGYTKAVSPSRDRSSTIGIKAIGGFSSFLTKLGVMNNKHIPREYLRSSYEDRVQLLSGILDGDGYLSANGYEIVQKSEMLAEGIYFLAKSLGLSVSITDKFSKCQNFEGGYYKRLFIYGDTSKLKLKLSRKVAHNKSDLRKNINTSLEVNAIGEGEYYGFELDGDHLFCLEDWTVTHNSTHVNNMLYKWIMDSDLMPTIISLEATEGQLGEDLFSLHLGVNLRWMSEEERAEYFSRDEVVDKIWSLLHKPDGAPRFLLIDERDADIEKCEKRMEKAYKQYGSRLFVFDVLTDALRGISADKQEEHMVWQKMFIKNDIRMVNVLHTRKPSKGKDGKPVPLSEYDSFGSSTFVQSGAYNILLERDKESTNPLVRNTTRSRLAKARKGITGPSGDFYFDFDSRQCYDYEDQFGEPFDPDADEPQINKNFNKKKEQLKSKTKEVTEQEKEGDSEQEDGNPFND